MSTGLTWLVIAEAQAANSPSVENSLIFNDYSEARDFADWLMRAYVSTIDAPAYKIFIYTTSPNNNGYYVWNGTPFWVSFD